jgi:hypothetical protein
VAGAEVLSCSQKDVELKIKVLFVVSESTEKELPLQLEDASRPRPLLVAQVRLISNFI